jgi:hypothetical protein
MCLVLSPTLFTISLFGKRSRNWGQLARRWRHGWLFVFGGLVLLLWFIKLGAPHGPSSIIIWVSLWLLPFSRISEILCAFSRDGLDQLARRRPKTAFTPVERIKAVAESYVEVALDFGIIYFFLPHGMFPKDFTGIIQAVYFSWVTITTTGYGDITPQRSLSQLLCMYEVAIGIVLIVFAVASYVASSGPVQNPPDEAA